MADAVTQTLPFADGLDASYSVKLEAFEGPLDLLLHLIRKNEVDIYNIPIAEITRQYLAYLDLMKELNLDVAGDFLVMAATLVQIKSRLLLPLPSTEEGETPEEEDPRAELVKRLLEYQRYREAADDLAARPLLGRDIFTRHPQPPEQEDLPVAEQPLEIDLFVLMEAFRQLLSRATVERFHEVGADSVSVADRITEILSLLEGRESLVFDELFPATIGRDYIVATFLALLELCRLHMLRVVQAQGFGTIWIMPAVTGPADMEEGESP